MDEQLSLDFGTEELLVREVPPKLIQWQNDLAPSGSICSTKSTKDRFFELEASSTEEMIRRALDKDEEIGALVDILKKDFQEVEMPLTHYFSGELYAREIFMPAGALVVGRIHMYDTISVVSQGEALVFSSGAGVTRVKAPATFMSSAGGRRILIILKDMVFTTMHITTERDPDKLREIFSVDSAKDLMLRLPK